MYRGREQSRPELGFRLLEKLSEDIEDIGFVEYAPKQEGRNMIMVIAPVKKKSEVKGARSQQRRDRERRDEERAQREQDEQSATPDATDNTEPTE